MNTQLQIPTEKEIALARESNRELSVLLATKTEIQEINIHSANGESKTITIPMNVLQLLSDILAEIGQGNAVSIIPIHTELTTQEAADLLNVSRPFVVSLLEKGGIPFHKVGTHRRVYFKDVMEYKVDIDKKREATLDELARQAQELNMGY